MACQACRRRLLGILVPELSSSSRQRLSHHAGRVYTSADSPRYQQRRGYSTPHVVPEPTKDDLFIPFDTSLPQSSTDPSNASITASPTQTFPPSTSSRQAGGASTSESFEGNNEYSFEPHLRIENNVSSERKYLGAEQEYSEIPKLGKHARKKLRRAQEAAALAGTDQSINQNAQDTAKAVTTSYLGGAMKQGVSKASNVKPIHPRRRMVTAREKPASTASTTRRLPGVSGSTNTAKGSFSKFSTVNKTFKPLQSRKNLEPWQQQKSGLREKFGDAHWTPNKKLSPDAMDGIRALHTQYPDRFTTPMLAKHFKMSPDAIRRILKSSWQPSAEEDEKRRERWENRGVRIWTKLAEKGVNPPEKWKDMGAGAGFSRTEIERGEAGKLASREMYKSESEKRLKQLMADIPDLR